MAITYDRRSRQLVVYGLRRFHVECFEQVCDGSKSPTQLLQVEGNIGRTLVYLQLLQLFVAASICSQEVIYLRAVLCSLGYGRVGPTRVYEDNASCIVMSENPVNAELSRHIDTRRYFIRDLVCGKLMNLVKCAGAHNPADALTKSLPSPSYELHMQHMCGTIVPYNSGVEA